METLELRTNLESLKDLEEFVFAENRRRPRTGETTQDLRLVLEEIFTNLVFHAYPGSEGPVTVSCFEDPEQRFCIQFRDGGIPFNPLHHQVADLHRDFDEREVGGLGIHLVREMVSEIHYAREGESNVLTVCF